MLALTPIFCVACDVKSTMLSGESLERHQSMAHWGPDVGVALLTWVTSTASHRCSLRALAEHDPLRRRKDHQVSSPRGRERVEDPLVEDSVIQRRLAGEVHIDVGLLDTAA